MAIFKVTAKPDFTELKSAISGLESTPIKIDIDTTPVIAKIKATSQNLSKMTQTFDSSGQMTGVVQQYNSKLGETVQVTRRLNKETGNLEVTQEKVTQNYEKVAKAAERAAQVQAKAQEAAQKAQEAEANRAAAEAQKIQNALGSMGTNIGTFSGNAAEAKEWIASLDGMSGATVKATGNVRNAAGVFQTYSAAVDGAKGTTDNFTFAINESTGEVYKLANGAVDAAKKNSLLGDSIGRVMLKMAAWQIFGDMISKVIGSFREAINTLKDVDTEMVNVQKVTDYSNTQMKELEENAYSLASAYGRTADEITAMYTTFARAGYLDDQLDSMAELGTLLANIGDISQDTAAKFLLAVDAAWKLNGSESELMTVMDGLNEITNKNAVDMEALTSGITVAGSVFAEAGESVQTFSALVGAGVAATQRSGSEISRGLRTIVMNIRQIKGETEDGELIDGESIAKASNALREYAGISTMANGQLRESSAVLSDLAGKWDTLDTVAQSAIAEALAGKRQANILTALMGNWDTVGKMMQDYADGAGSALRENEIYLDSWEAKSKQLTASWTEFVSHLVETDTIKGALDGVIGLVELLDTDVGRFVITVAALTTGVTVLGKGLSWLKGTELIKNGKALVGIFGDMAKGAGSFSDVLTLINPKTLIVVAAVAALAAAIYVGTQKQREYNNALQETEAIQSKLGETQSEYDGLINKTGELTAEEKKRLDVLKELRQEQEKQLEAAKKAEWTAWNNLHGSGASAVVGGAEGVGGGLGVGAVKMERMDVVALRNYREELEAIEAQYRAGELSAGAYYDALQDLNAAREDSVETIRAAIDAGYEVTEEQRQLVAAYDRVQQMLGVTQNATKDYVSKLIEEARQSGATGKALYDLVAAQIAASNQGLNFSQQMSALRELAVQAGYASSAIASVFAFSDTEVTNQIRAAATGLMRSGQAKTSEEAMKMAKQNYINNIWGSLSTFYKPSGGSYGGSSYAPSSGGGSGSSAKSKQNEIDNAKKKAAQATIDAIKKQRDAEIAAIDEKIDALKKQNEEEDRSKKLEELKLDVLKKQDALLNARNERTVRQYNAATGQWEWVANPEKVKQAQEDLENAKKELREYEADVERETAVAELEARKKAIEAAYQLKIDGWQKLIDQLNGDVETEKALLAASLGDWDAYYQEMLKVYEKLVDAAGSMTDGEKWYLDESVRNNQIAANDVATAWEDAAERKRKAMDAVSSAIINKGIAGSAPSAAGSSAANPYLTKDNDPRTHSKPSPSGSPAPPTTTTKPKKPMTTTKPSGMGGGSRFNTNVIQKYDSGGILKGMGGIKATEQDEMILPPDITARMTRLSRTGDVQQLFRSMRSVLFGGGIPYGQSVAGTSSTDRHDVTTNNYTVNGVPISPRMAKMPVEEIIAELTGAAHQMRPFSNG